MDGQSREVEARESLESVAEKAGLAHADEVKGLESGYLIGYSNDGHVHHHYPRDCEIGLKGPHVVCSVTDQRRRDARRPRV